MGWKSCRWIASFVRKKALYSTKLGLFDLFYEEFTAYCTNIVQNHKSRPNLERLSEVNGNPIEYWISCKRRLQLFSDGLHSNTFCSADIKGKIHLHVYPSVQIMERRTLA
jgi:hypothetical protein